MWRQWNAEIAQHLRAIEPTAKARCSTLVVTGLPFTVVANASRFTGSSVGSEMLSSGPSTLISGIGNATSTVTALSVLLKKR
jgi:hypothetical protein